MLDYADMIARMERLPLPGADRDRASARVRRAQMTIAALNERASTVDEQADNLACDLLMERLNSWVDCRFVPDID
jgi:hypothetical protein